MKKTITFSISILIISVILSVSVFASQPGYENKIESSAKTGNTVNLNNKNYSKNVIEARFLNMLNHNYSYNDDFNSTETLINNSVLSLLNLRDNANSDFIKESFVKDYIFNMYGIEISNFGEYNTDFPSLPGYVYIIPKGITEYKHSIVSVHENEDGTFSVVTNVTITSHDSKTYTCKAESLFVTNSKSSFGFNMIYSDLDTDSINL